MKLRIKTVQYSILFFIAVFACNGPEGNLPEKLVTGVNARIIFAYPDNVYVNYTDVNNAAIKFDLYSANSDLDKVEYSATYTSSKTGVQSASSVVLSVPSSSFSNGKVTGLTIKATDLISKLNIKDPLNGGDKFGFTAKAYLIDGRTFDGTNSAPNITNSASASFTSKFDAYVGCQTNRDAIEGTYISTIEYNDGGEPTGIQNEVKITWKGPEPFRYSVTDHTGKLYVPYGGKEYPADFYDICGIPVLLSSVSFGPVVNYVPLASEVPPFSNPIIDLSQSKTVIIFTWYETFNGIKATMKFVKK